MTQPKVFNESTRDFWSGQHHKFEAPHFRQQKAARLINAVAPVGRCRLLDVGCARSSLKWLLEPDIEYFGIDIFIARPAPYLRELDIVENPIAFDGLTFDLVAALGLFEYLGGTQEEKFREIASLLTPDGRFVVTYGNFDHRRPHIYGAYTNVQSPAAFRSSLERHFIIERQFPTALNRTQTQPVRRLTKAVNMRVRHSLPVVTPKLAVEYFFVCRNPG
ncbi:MAG: class I SAM-dependent methyltransferase [Acidimicrobiales bacterium]